ncbi:FG-GAP-like repeat-containing protein [Flavobacteriaceae bacterium F08102]|nr:FG-GAP-like repeat-containing protein [Flavobacteriaceae bacterium F08102]
MKKKLLSILLFLVYVTIYAQSFTERSANVGIAHKFEAIGEFGGGCVFFDYDNDGWEDLYITGGKSADVLYRNKGNGTFELIVDSGLGITQDYYTTGVSSGDINNDGYRDLFVTTWSEPDFAKNVKRNLLFLNNKGNGFIEIGESAGITIPSFSMGAVMIDYNRDSFLDIYVINYIENSKIPHDENGNVVFDHDCYPNQFYQNNGDGTFTEKAAELGLSDSGCALAAMPTDFDLDNDTDIYLANDFGAFIEPNAIFQNNDPVTTFTKVSTTTGLDIGVFGMGIASGDYDKDGHLDYYVANLGRNVLLKNDGNQHFTDESTYAGTENKYSLDGNGSEYLSTSWGTAFLDVNNDTWPDLFVANGYIFSNAPYRTGAYDPNKLFVNQGDNTFTDVSISAGIDDPNIARGMAYCDFDQDGDLDIFTVVQGKSPQAGSTNHSNFFINQLNPNQSANNNWIQFKLEGTNINRDAIGAKVILTVNGEQLIQEVHGQGSHSSQHSLVLHFGVANASVIDEVKVVWSKDHTEKFTSLSANQRYTIKEEKISTTDVIGCTDPLSCNYNPLATIDNGSCEYLVPGEISGVMSSGFNKTEVYTYPSTSGSVLTWTVEGGTIFSGQGTGRIEVVWGLAETGKLTVIENNKFCFGDVQELTVELDISNGLRDYSVARLWNEVLLEAIRGDFARPIVHARNLFHTSIAMYDTWAIYEGTNPYLTGNVVHNFKSSLEPFTSNKPIEESKKEAMSYAVYRLLMHRFKNSPSANESLARFEVLMKQLGYDSSYNGVDYTSGNPADLGNYVGQLIIDYGLNDNAREATGYDNDFYEPVNPALVLNPSGHATGIIESNRWQPLTFNTFIDQSGNLIPGATPTFLGPEWGAVHPFALSEREKQVLRRDGHDFIVYHNPEMPPRLSEGSQASREQYKWNFSLVSMWSSHLDPTDGVLWDISPNTIGNIDSSLFPTTYEEYPNFFNVLEGGDISTGYTVNPKTGKPYEPQVVPRADYTRVLAEFWADGPDSETPPGHWFTILNYVTDHEQFVPRFNGKGPELDALEWDVKAYFILGGAMHDAAVTAWGIKGWYDYIRPISAIRYMCELGQSTDPSLPHYEPQGIALKEGYIEVIKAGDPLSGANNEHVGKIKLYAWKGHDFISDAKTDVAGVGWILAENWWPYQRPSFVTPPFAGFISGHSTFSRAAAEVMTLVTGDAYFPGGMGEFVAKKNEFLVFEKGPSVDVTLQWATYRDASDQTSLSRIWGGIHPPADDIPGRIIGEKIGVEAYNYALPYFEPKGGVFAIRKIEVYPNPTNDLLYFTNLVEQSEILVYSLDGKLIRKEGIQNGLNGYEVAYLPTGIYLINVYNKQQNHRQLIIKK